MQIQTDKIDAMVSHSSELIIIESMLQECSPEKMKNLLRQMSKTVRGVLVDKVSDVIVLNHDEIDYSYTGSQESHQNFIQGVAKKNDLILILLNPESLIPKDIIHDYKREQSEP